MSLAGDFQVPDAGANLRDDAWPVHAEIGKRDAEPDRRQLRYELFAVASFTGLVTAIVFLSWPDIDLAVSRLFFGDDGRFIYHQHDAAEFVRDSFRLLFVGALVMASAGLLIEYVSPRRLFGLGRRRWMFVLAALIVGPGLVANTVFKDNWGRARPLHLEEFGREKIFTPAIAISDQCQRNCAFVGGDAAAIYGLFFALAMVAAAYRRRWIVAGIVLGSLVGLLRIGQGGHFASDIIFAGVFMALSVVLLDWLFSLGDDPAER